MERNENPAVHQIKYPAGWSSPQGSGGKMNKICRKMKERFDTFLH